MPSDERGPKLYLWSTSRSPAFVMKTATGEDRVENASGYSKIDNEPTVEDGAEDCDWTSVQQPAADKTSCSTNPSAKKHEDTNSKKQSRYSAEKRIEGQRELSANHGSATHEVEEEEEEANSEAEAVADMLADALTAAVMADAAVDARTDDSAAKKENKTDEVPSRPPKRPSHSRSPRGFGSNRNSTRYLPSSVAVQEVNVHAHHMSKAEKAADVYSEWNRILRRLHRLRAPYLPHRPFQVQGAEWQYKAATDRIAELELLIDGIKQPEASQNEDVKQLEGALLGSHWRPTSAASSFLENRDARESPRPSPNMELRRWQQQQQQQKDNNDDDNEEQYQVKYLTPHFEQLPAPRRTGLSETQRSIYNRPSPTLYLPTAAGRPGRRRSMKTAYRPFGPSSPALATASDPWLANFADIYLDCYINKHHKEKVQE